MCVKLGKLEESLASFAADFDAAFISAGEAEGVMERAARMEHMCATVKALAAARVAETELWRGDGDKSPAHMLAKRTGKPVSAAQQQLDNAKRLKKHPKTNEAARKGKLSPEQQAAITDAADADPDAEDDLLKLADKGSLGELRDEAARRKAVTTTTSRPMRAGVWWRALASGPSCRPMTLGIRAMPRRSTRTGSDHHRRSRSSRPLFVTRPR